MVARTTSEGWIISHRCSWITVYLFFRNAQSESHSDPHDICGYLYSINCPAVIFLPSMLFILWRDTTSDCGPRSNFLYIAIIVYYFTCLFTFSHTITFYHSIRLIFSLQQTSEIDNLIVSWGKVLGSVVCRFHVAAGEEAPTSTTHQYSSGTVVQSVTKLASIIFGSLAFSYWFNKPWFHN
jgi:hypothetical protein